jgi:hypothetical protein
MALICENPVTVPSFPNLARMHVNMRCCFRAEPC